LLLLGKWVRAGRFFGVGDHFGRGKNG